MGGINHQPCNKSGTRYLILSTRMSRSFTTGRSIFEAANSHLEDVILVELQSRCADPKSLQKCNAGIQDSVRYLDQALEIANELEQEMRDKGYTPLPATALYASIPLIDQLGQRMAAAGLLKFEAFQKIAHPQLDGNGFYGSLQVLKETISTLRDIVAVLDTAVMDAASLAKDGKVADELETNGPLSFRRHFMRAYAAWNEAYDLFLASATLSTELWFQSTGNGSLLEDGVAHLKQTA